jgi:hypothetical protein
VRNTCVTLVVGLGLFATGCGSESAGTPDSGTPDDAGDGGITSPADGGGPPASFVLGLVLNDGVDERAPRGWPLVLMGIAALTDDVPRVVLDAASLQLSIEDDGGAFQAWAFDVPMPLDGDVVLDDAKAQFEVTWALRGDQTEALPLGRYTARLSLGDQTSPPVTIEVVDLAPTSDPVESATRTRRRAGLEARVALLRADAPAALSAVDTALAEVPDDVALLVWRGKANAAADRVEDALFDFDTADARVRAENDSGEPAVTISENRRPVLERYFQGAR